MTTSAVLFRSRPAAELHQNISFHDLIVFIFSGDSILISSMAPVENPTKMEDCPVG
jgi:hypothetical protein